MKKYSNKKAIIIGYGGMGKRYEIALKKLGIKIEYICDKKDFKSKQYSFVKNYKDLLDKKVNLVCIVTDTQTRKKILFDFLKYSKVENFIIEKPLANSLKDTYQIKKYVKKYKKRILVNTFRSMSENFKEIKKIFKKYNEEIKSIYVNSPYAGIGNMCSVFFDLCNYFLGTKIKNVYGILDKTNTPNPRGKKYKDPGCRGFLEYQKNKRVFFDLSEDTAMPYRFIVKSRNIEFFIEEINNIFYYYLRDGKMLKKPNYFYLFKPKKINIKAREKFNPALQTTNTIRNIFDKNYKSNLEDSVKVMEIIFAIKASSLNNGIIKLPMKNKYYNLNFNFA